MNDSVGTDVYFTPLLPWQTQAWQQLTEQFTNHHLPHGLLAAGMAGIGKRAFVWRFVAYVLCEHRTPLGACQQCASCQWLKAGTHPDLLALPASALPDAEAQSASSIKIEDIRVLQEYSHTKGRGAKVIVLDQAETMTIAAANALLKTLEEPRDGVFLILMSDYPARLLPTIRSRVQQLPLMQIDEAVAIQYLSQKGIKPTQAQMLLKLSDGAVLSAESLSNEAWFEQRLLWLKTFIALRQKKRLPIAASDYWQTVLGLGDFLKLSRMMLLEIWRVLLKLPSLHTDIPTKELLGDLSFSQMRLDALLHCLDEVQIATQQNVQEKMAYDRIMIALCE